MKFVWSRRFAGMSLLLIAVLANPAVSAQRPVGRTPVVQRNVVQRNRVQRNVVQRSGAAAPERGKIIFHTDLSYAGNDNPRQCLDLLLPTQPANDRPLPVIVYIHGGAWRAGDRASGHRQLFDYVAGGQYAGVSVGYRLTGESRWPAQIHDCKAAIRWIRANAQKYQLDATKIGVFGHSAGGHLVAMLGTSGDVIELEGNLGAHTEFSSRVQCVIDAFGPSDLLAMKDYPSQIDHDAARSPEGKLIGGRVSQNPKKAKSASPITYVSSDDPPFLIIHGDQDRLVPLNQSQRFAKALKQSEIPCSLTTVVGGGHGGFRHPEIDAQQRRFFQTHLLGVPAQFQDRRINNQSKRGS